MRSQVIIEFTRALDDSVATVLELALKKAEVAVIFIVLLKFVYDVILTFWHLLLVLGLTRVKVSTHYHIHICP